MVAHGYTDQNRVRLISGGKEYFTLLHEMIRHARATLYLQFYIYDDDQTGQELRQALIQAAAKGVDVFLLVDGYASQNLSKQFVSGLRQAGVQFRWFEPLFKSRKFYFGRRMHHKVVVADGIRSLVGGINISNRYNDMPGTPAWMDMALYCEGEACRELQQRCRSLWGRQAPDRWDPVAAGHFYQQIGEERQRVRIRRNDWVKRKNQVTKSYLYMLLHARKEICIMCSYFLPGIVFRREISNAVKRGVHIRVILAGASDVKVAKHAERYLYDWLLKNKIEIYEYQRTILHAKLAVYDSAWVTVGSYNVNNISAYASLELNMDVLDHDFAAATSARLEQIIRDDCKQITRENFLASRNIFIRIWRRACYGFINTMLSLFTFYFKQEE